MIGRWPPSEHRDRSGNGSPRGSCSLALLGFVYVAYIYLTLPDVRALAKNNPTDDGVHAAAHRRSARRRAGSFPSAINGCRIGRVSPFLRRAVIVTEDAAFFDHDGIDLTEIKASLEKNWEEGQFLRGGSTHHAAAGEESLPVAVAQPDAQGDGAADRAAARSRADQAAHLRDLPEHDRVGRRHLRLRSRGARVFRQVVRAVSTSRKRRCWPARSSIRACTVPRSRRGGCCGGSRSSCGGCSSSRRAPPAPAPANESAPIEIR